MSNLFLYDLILREFFCDLEVCTECLQWSVSQRIKISFSDKVDVGFSFFSECDLLIRIELDRRSHCSVSCQRGTMRLLGLTARREEKKRNDEEKKSKHRSTI